MIRKLLDRRTFLNGICATSGAALLRLAENTTQAQGPNRGLRIWDVHCHMYRVPGDTPEQRIEFLVRLAGRMGIERLILSQGYSANLHPTADQLREENDRVLRAARRFPDRVYGSVYLSPSHLEASLEEFDRCVRDGPMIGIGELEIDKRCNGPELDPIVERAVSMKAPILQHCWLKTGGNEPGESSPNDLVELATRHPDGTFICAHTGGNWERGIRMIRDTKNICAEIAGSDPTSGFVEMAVRELGAERVVYGSDVGGRSFASQLGKVKDAEIPQPAKDRILGANLRELMTPILKAKGIHL